MAIELNAETIDRVVLQGDNEWVLTPGKTLKVEESPSGTEQLSYECPDDGLTRTALVYVRIIAE